MNKSNFLRRSDSRQNSTFDFLDNNLKRDKEARTKP